MPTPSSNPWAQPSMRPACCSRAQPPNRAPLRGGLFDRGRVSGALKQAETALANLSSMTAENAGLRYNLELFLTELAATARSLRTFSDYLDRHPDSLLRGKTSDQPMEEDHEIQARHRRNLHSDPALSGRRRMHSFSAGQRPQTRFFMLSSLASCNKPAQPLAMLPHVALGIGPVRPAPYPDRRNIIVRNSRSEFELVELSQWAEPVQDMFARVTADNLSVLLGTNRVVLFPGGRQCRSITR